MPEGRVSRRVQQACKGAYRHAARTGVRPPPTTCVRVVAFGRPGTHPGTLQRACAAGHRHGGVGGATRRSRQPMGRERRRPPPRAPGAGGRLPPCQPSVPAPNRHLYRQMSSRQSQPQQNADIFHMPRVTLGYLECFTKAEHQVIGKL